MQGEPEAVMDYYNAMLADRQNQDVKQEVLNDGKVQTISGTGEAVVSSIQLLNDTGQPIEVVDVGQSICLRIEVQVHDALPRLVLGYGVKDRLGQVMYGTNTDLKKQELVAVSANSRYVFNIYFNANLGPGTYSVHTALVSTDTHLVNNYEWRDLALVFNVMNVNKPHFAGCAWMDPRIEIATV
jgi:lipopolysaccharide transport system ATP-binding protein